MSVESDKYMQALETLRTRTDALQSVMSDPFKAPELALEHFSGLQSAMFGVCVKYQVMLDSHR